MKKISMIILSFIISGMLIAMENPVFNKKNAIIDMDENQISDVNAIEIVNDMRTGWNLGNTLDATGASGLSSETSWQQPLTTKKMIDELAYSGMRTIRLPVSWHNHIIDDNYTIDPEWMKRVKEIVDWAYNDGLYVILNTHHDNYGKNAKIPYGMGYYPSKENYDESSRFLVNVWSQICLAFNNGYDEHLIFETMNEPRPAGTSEEWNFLPGAKISSESAEVLNQLNQDVVDTIRKSGGNNKIRLIAVPGLQASPQSVLSDRFKIPNDIQTGKLIIAVHMYTPYNFAGESPGVNKYSNQMGSELATNFKKLNEKFIKKGYAVYIGEYGATNKNNLDDRVKWFEAFIKYSKKYGMIACLWDNGVWYVNGSDYAEHFGYFNRKKCEWYFPEILEVIKQESK